MRGIMGLPDPYYDHAGITIYHGDCLEIMPHLEKVDLVLTDPPYGMNLNTDFSKMKSKMFKGKTGGNYHTPVIGDNIFFNPIPAMNLLKETKEQFWFGADYYSDRIPERIKGSWFVWDKRLTQSADEMWGSCFELIWSKTPHKRDILRVKWAGVFGMEKQDIRTRIHPTQKPLELMRLIILRWSNEGDLIGDFYLGSGTTLVAAKELGRRAIGIEIEEKYCEIAAERLAQEVFDFD